mmetsp:Transcript_33480/g.44386  ORF Transcript_33480/g.44386 Transcript_33480/m.44386 type:complete len:138 (+) Transcript_33480:1322-1735(+)
MGRQVIHYLPLFFYVSCVFCLQYPLSIFCLSDDIFIFDHDCKGGGRNIVRVDLTGDNGETWTTAEIQQGGDQKFGRAWAWVFWSCELPATIQDDGTVHVHSKALDHAFNVQPEHCRHTWNIRGLGNNSWHSKHMKVN